MIFLILLGCGSSDILTHRPKSNIYFSDLLVEYQSRALLFSHLTKNKKIQDEKNSLTQTQLEKIKGLSIYTENTMNFINPYNDSLTVIYSFPKRYCLSNQSLKSYIANFSEAMHYIVIDNGKSLRIDSLNISHETRVVPPIDCAKSDIKLPYIIKNK